MPQSPEETPSAVQPSGSSIGQKITWLWQHPWKATLNGILIAAVLSPVWSQLVTSSDAYKALEAKKPVDGMLKGLVWLLSGTITTPVPGMVALLALLAFLLGFWWRRRNAGTPQVARTPESEASKPNEGVQALEAELKREKQAADNMQRKLSLVLSEKELSETVRRERADSHAKEIAGLKAEIRRLTPPAGINLTDLQTQALKMLVLSSLEHATVVTLANGLQKPFAVAEMLLHQFSQMTPPMAERTSTQVGGQGHAWKPTPEATQHLLSKGEI